MSLSPQTTAPQGDKSHSLPSPPNSSFGDDKDAYLPENYTIEHNTSSSDDTKLKLQQSRRRRRRRSTSSHESTTSSGSSGSTTAKDRYQCRECGKVYKHPNCLSKHQWEHSAEWEFTSQFLLTKHQQVQLLEAAAILMNMMHHGVNSSSELQIEDDDLL